jgi:DNA topoisomerase-2
MMEWRDNMTSSSAPEITKAKAGKNYTCITFYPDLKRFKLSEITTDIENLLKKRVYDIAGIFNSKVTVFLNNEKIQIKKFKDYIDYYLPGVEDNLKIYDKSMTTDRWEIMASFSDGQFKQVSFVNAICTIRGGTHVANIADKIVEKIQE